MGLLLPRAVAKKIYGDENKVDAVYRLSRLGIMPGVVRLGKRYFYDEGAIDEFIRKGGSPSPAHAQAHA